jgi:hypothetical protein
MLIMHPYHLSHLFGRSCKSSLKAIRPSWLTTTAYADNRLNRLTSFNVAISIVALFLLLLKLVTFIMKVWYPIAACVINSGLVAIWAVSVYGQMGPDYADPRYPSPIAWYISKSCNYAPDSLVKSCMLAKGTFAVTVAML